MGILDDQKTILVPPASVAANSLIQEARDVWNRMVGSFNEGARFFWQHPEGLAPQEIADALGTSGQEVFSLHGKLGELIASVNQAAVADGLAVVGEFSYADDGSLVIAEPVPLPQDFPLPASPE